MRIWVAAVTIAMLSRAPLPAAELLVGWASASITPDRPVALSGQFHTRISKSVHDPITATELALDNGRDQAVMVSLDLVSVSRKLIESVRERLKTTLPEFDGRNLRLPVRRVTPAEMEAAETEYARIEKAPAEDNKRHVTMQWILAIMERYRRVELACGEGDYLPTAKAIAGGGYGAEIASNLVGPEGGQMLVDRTVASINSLFE